MASTSLIYQTCGWYSSSAVSTLPLPRTCLSVAPANAVRCKKRAFELRAARETATEVVKLNKDTAEFYDELSGLWEDLWGDHMHHGFYDPMAADVAVLDLRAAQMICSYCRIKSKDSGKEVNQEEKGLEEISQS